MNWDKIEAAKLREIGLTQEQIGFVLGRIAEHRMAADREGYKRGFDGGWGLHELKQSVEQRIIPP